MSLRKPPPTTAASSPPAMILTRLRKVQRADLSPLEARLTWRFPGAMLIVNDFRKDCLRELHKIKDAWPDLHYQTVKGALLLSPSPPRIAPASLRLVE